MISATIIVIINIIFFTTFLIPWIFRWFNHYDHLSKDLKHPVFSNFFVTMPVALMILATNILNIGGSYFTTSTLMTLAFIFWIIGAILTIIFSVTTTYNMMMAQTIHPQMTNFAWFISPVANIIPLLGNNITKYYASSHLEIAQLINLINISFFGIGFILFLILSAIIFNRFIFHKMPGSLVLPSFYIMLGPIGVGTISLMGLSSANVTLGLITSVQVLNFLALILWGFGFWALGLLILITIMYIRQGKIPFSLSWWAFIFPLSAYILSTISIYHYLHYEFLHTFAMILTSVLSILFLITLTKTAIGMVSKKLFHPVNHDS
jgi:C4-dicarboxylate transporter/malic acid transport protein